MRRAMATCLVLGPCRPQPGGMRLQPRGPGAVRRPDRRRRRRGDRGGDRRQPAGRRGDRRWRRRPGRRIDQRPRRQSRPPDLALTSARRAAAGSSRSARRPAGPQHPTDDVDVRGLRRRDVLGLIDGVVADQGETAVQLGLDPLDQTFAGDLQHVDAEAAEPALPWHRPAAGRHPGCRAASTPPPPSPAAGGSGRCRTRTGPTHGAVR